MDGTEHEELLGDAARAGNYVPQHWQHCPPRVVEVGPVHQGVREAEAEAEAEAAGDWEGVAADSKPWRCVAYQGACML